MFTLKQFILWDKQNKTPVIPGAKSWTDRSRWMSYEAALYTARAMSGHGVGFVFTAEDPYVFIDLDNCIDEQGNKNDFASAITAMLPRAACEVSQSGRGLHLFCRGTIPSGYKQRSNDPKIEIYTHGRYAALGGGEIVGDPNIDYTPQLIIICERYLKGGSAGAPRSEEWTEGPVEGYRGPQDDNELIARAVASMSPRAAFGKVPPFRALWDADADVLAQHYPGTNHLYDESAADLALASALAFWTGKDCARIERLMWRSALRREKWENRVEDYLRRTILRAVGSCGNTLGGDSGPPPDLAAEMHQAGISTVPPPPPAAPAPPDGGEGRKRVYNTADQIELFKGCVFVKDENKVLTPNGYLLPPPAFSNGLPSRMFLNGYTKKGEPRVTTKAFEAFRENPEYEFPTVDGVYWSPLEPYQTVKDLHGRVVINTYYPMPGPRKRGDPGPFVRHLETLLPVEADREVFVQYLAHCVQRPGHKAAWAPVLIGAQGNGKTMIGDIVRRAVGVPYSHDAKPGDLRDTKFNGWMVGKLVCFVEEMKVSGVRDVAENMKPLISNEYVAVQPKGVDQYTAENYCNFVFFSNHEDAVLKEQGDRRYAVLMTAQASREAVEAAFDPWYFQRLFRWLKEADGYAICADYLDRYPITLDMGGRAPHTSFEAQAIRYSQGPVEQAVYDAILDEIPGLSGEYVLFDAAKAVADRAAHRGTISNFAMAKILESMGYIPHPLLSASEGRIRMGNMGLKRVYVNKKNIDPNIDTLDRLRSDLSSKNIIQ